MVLTEFGSQEILPLYYNKIFLRMNRFFTSLLLLVNLYNVAAVPTSTQVSKKCCTPIDHPDVVSLSIHISATQKYSSTFLFPVRSCRYQVYQECTRRETHLFKSHLPLCALSCHSKGPEANNFVPAWFSFNFV